jgi:hypothetical protein
MSEEVHIPKPGGLEEEVLWLLSEPVWERELTTEEES